MKKIYNGFSDVFVWVVAIAFILVVAYLYASCMDFQESNCNGTIIRNGWGRMIYCVDQR